MNISILTVCLKTFGQDLDHNMVKPSHGKDIGPILIPLHMRAAFDTHNIQYRDKDI